jgi:ATP-binding cassette subfamily B protein
MMKEFRTILPYAKKHIVFYILGFLSLIVTDAGQLLLPQFLKRAVDLLSVGDFMLDRVGLLMIEMVAVALCVSMFRFAWRYFIHGASMRIEKELRQTFFRHLLTLSSSFYQRNKTGDLMARATNDLKSVRMACGMGLVAFTDGLFMTVAILAIIVADNPRLSVLTILPLPLLTFLVIRMGPLLGKRFKKVQEDYSGLSDMAQESFSGIKVIKSFVRERRFIDLFDAANDRYQKSTMRLVRIWGFFFPVIGFLSGLTMLLLLLFGGRKVMDGEISPGDFVALLSYLEMLLWPMLGAGFTVNMFQRGGASLARINEVLSEKPDIASPDAPAAAASFFGLVVRDLTFSYPDAKEPSLRNVSFSLVPGMTLGILGRTGSGKSTLLKILPRLLDPPPGAVFVNGTDIREIDLADLRGLYGLVPQDTFLFSESIRENIAFGNPDAAEAVLAAAATLSTIDRDLSDFPQGWETEVGERGVTLSGGQKQRVAISRAVVPDAPVLLLDDALSSVDTDTERKILQGLFRERSGKTTVIVSHRISTLERTDYILVLDRGRVVQEGSHADLVSRDGLYREIWRLQSLEAGEARR